MIQVLEGGDCSCAHAITVEGWRDLDDGALRSQWRRRFHFTICDGVVVSGWSAVHKYNWDIVNEDNKLMFETCFELSLEKESEIYDFVGNWYMYLGNGYQYLSEI